LLLNLPSTNALTVKVEPKVGFPSTRVYISGQAENGIQINVYFDGALVATAHASEWGGDFWTDFSVPPTATVGEHTIKIEDTRGWGREYITFTVPKVKIDLSPPSGEIGTKCTINVSISPSLEEEMLFFITFEDQLLFFPFFKSTWSGDFCVPAATPGDHNVKLKLWKERPQEIFVVAGTPFRVTGTGVGGLERTLHDLGEEVYRMRTEINNQTSEIASLRALVIVSLVIAIVGIVLAGFHILHGQTSSPSPRKSIQKEKMKVRAKSTCSKCGAELPSDAEFCPECGHKAK